MAAHCEPCSAVRELMTAGPAVHMSVEKVEQLLSEV
jgi:hypothetical protein